MPPARARRRPRGRAQNRSQNGDFESPAVGPISIGNPTIMVSGKKTVPVEFSSTQDQNSCLSGFPFIFTTFAATRRAGGSRRLPRRPATLTQYPVTGSGPPGPSPCSSSSDEHAGDVACASEIDHQARILDDLRLDHFL